MTRSASPSWGLVPLAASLLLNVVLAAQVATAPAAATTPPVLDAEALAAALEAAPLPPPVLADVRYASGRIDRSLSHTIAAIAPEGGPALTAVVARLLQWELDPHRDLRRGDTVKLAWRPSDQGEPEVIGLVLDSGKLGRTVQAWRFRPEGEARASWWTPDGIELPRRLYESPLDDYEQITALPGDGRDHHGMDFTGAVGTPVHSPRAATVVRTDWNTRYNGNCVEVRYADGTFARFLHLEGVEVHAGQVLEPGQVVGTLGNTGRSTAPHLHYELERGGTILDPLEVHGAWRRTLSAPERERLEAVRVTLAQQLEPGPVAAL